MKVLMFLLLTKTLLIYGKQPELVQGSNDLTENNRLIPTTSIEQYAASLTSWLGLNDDSNLALFPNLKNFPEKNVGFMKPV